MDSFHLAATHSFAASALLSLSSGEAAIGLKDIPSVLGDKEQMEYYILTQIRMPRIILALAVGGSLSLAEPSFRASTGIRLLNPIPLEYQEVQHLELPFQ